MLSQKTIDIVKSTAPVLEEHGEALTRHFYQRMFNHNPEVKPFFNPANQAQGAQQRALANAICAYAANIDRLDRLGSAVELIAHKHASLMVKPEHYPIVGENLLASIREVLGPGATDEIIAAWSEAYNALADILIQRESQIYDHNASRPGGWNGFRPFRVEQKVPESEIVTSFYLKPADERPAPSFLPGQYITIQMATPDGSTTMRNYSLSCQPGLESLRISVKRESRQDSHSPEGFVSNQLHDAVQVGDTLQAGPPCGEFVLESGAATQRPLVLLAGGIGITPLLSMLNTAVETTPTRPIVLIYACRNPRVQAFREHLDQLAHNHEPLTVHYRYSDEDADPTPAHSSTGLVDATLIDALMPTRDADYYVCGPKPFMQSIIQTLGEWQIPPAQVRSEFFGPQQALHPAIQEA